MEIKLLETHRDRQADRDRETDSQTDSWPPQAPGPLRPLAPGPHLALGAVVQPDAGPGHQLRVGVAAQLGLQGAPHRTVAQPLKLVQGVLGPHVPCRATAAQHVDESRPGPSGPPGPAELRRTLLLPLGLTPAKLHLMAWKGKLRKSLLQG